MRSSLFDQCGIPACRLSQGDGKDCAVAVDHIPAEQQRYSEAALVAGDPLRFRAVRRAARVQKRSPAALTDLDLHGVGKRCRQRSGLRKLPELLVQGHAGDQYGDALFQTGVWRIAG